MSKAEGEFKSDFELNAVDRAEIERLAERTHALAGRMNAMTRRQFISGSAGVLTFVLPAIATFAVPSDALGRVGSRPRTDKKEKEKEKKKERREKRSEKREKRRDRREKRRA